MPSRQDQRRMGQSYADHPKQHIAENAIPCTGCLPKRMLRDLAWDKRRLPKDGLPDTAHGKYGGGCASFCDRPAVCCAGRSTGGRRRPGNHRVLSFPPGSRRGRFGRRCVSHAGRIFLPDRVGSKRTMRWDQQLYKEASNRRSRHDRRYF